MATSYRKTDGAVKNYGDIPSTSATNQSSASVCTDDQRVEVVDGSTLISKTTIDNQSKQNPINSTPLKELLKVSTTSKCIEKISKHINKPTIQCLSPCSLIESFMNDINILKRKYSEFEEKLNNATVNLDKLINERESHINNPQNKVEAEDDDSDSKKRHEVTLDILFMLKKKVEEICNPSTRP
ncbi:hypothetical protein ACI65C_000310 [Semiaphis heraclei]